MELDSAMYEGRDAQTLIDIPNNHLGYALTWYGLAAALAGVFVAYASSRRRSATIRDI